jgi:hypothetical protein
LLGQLVTQAKTIAYLIGDPNERGVQRAKCLRQRPRSGRR